MKNLVTVIGARPQFIKAAPLSKALKEAGINETLIHTGQHFDKKMSDIFFEQMQIPKPDYNLQVHGLNHGAMTGRMMEGIEEILLEKNPDLLLVYGDTNSTLAGALAASKLHVPVAHVEAGLRSFNMKMPEEINRILTDRVSSYLFCPTVTAINNLEKEGFNHFSAKIVNSGDVMLDASLHFHEIAKKESTIIQSLNIAKNGYILATIHRQENTDDPTRLGSIVEALNHINQQKEIIVPLHPRTRKYIKEYGLNVEFSIIEPVGYLDMIMLISNWALVITDSGGLQKEAFFFKKYCITLRDETEWIELVEGGYNVLAGAIKEKILQEFNNLSDREADFNKSIYGSGEACGKIVEVLKSSSFSEVSK